MKKFLSFLSFFSFVCIGGLFTLPIQTEAQEFILLNLDQPFYVRVPYKLQFDPPLEPELLSTYSLKSNYQSLFSIQWNQTFESVLFDWNINSTIPEDASFVFQLTLYQNNQKISSSSQFQVENSRSILWLDPTPGSSLQNSKLNASKSSFFVSSQLSYEGTTPFSKISFYIYDWQLKNFVVYLGFFTNQSASYPIRLPYFLFNGCQTNYNYSLVAVPDIWSNSVVREVFDPYKIASWSPFRWNFRCLNDISLTSLVYTALPGTSAAQVYPGTNLTLNWVPDSTGTLGMTIKLLQLQQPSVPSLIVLQNIPSSLRSTTFLWPSLSLNWCNKQQILVVETPDLFSGETKFFSFSTLTTRCWNNSLESLVLTSPCSGCSYSAGSTLSLNWFNGPFQRELEWSFIPSSSSSSLSNAVVGVRVNNTLLSQITQTWTSVVGTGLECGVSNSIQVKDLFTQQSYRLPQTFSISCKPTYFEDIQVLSPIEGSFFANNVRMQINWTSSLPNQWVGVYVISTQNVKSEYFLQRVYVGTSNLQTLQWKIPSDFPCDDSELYYISVRYWNSGFSDGQSGLFSISCLEKTQILNRQDPWPPVLGQSVTIEWESRLMTNTTLLEGLITTQGFFPQSTTMTLSGSFMKYNNETQSVGAIVSSLGMVDLSQLSLTWQIPYFVSCQKWYIFRFVDQWTWLNQASFSQPFLLGCNPSLLNTMTGITLRPNALYFHDPASDMFTLNISWTGSIQGRTIRLDFVDSNTTLSRPIYTLATRVDSNQLYWVWSNISVQSFPFLCSSNRALSTFNIRLSYESLSLDEEEEEDFPEGPGTGNGSLVRTSAGWSQSPSFSILCRNEINNDPSIWVTSPANNSLLFPETSYTLQWTGGLLKRPLSIGVYNVALRAFAFWLTSSHFNVLNNQSLPFTFPKQQFSGCGNRFQFVYRYLDADNPFDLMFTTNIYDFACSQIEITRPLLKESIYPGSTFSLHWNYGLAGRSSSVFLRHATQRNVTYFLGRVSTSSGDTGVDIWIRSTKMLFRLPDSIPCGESYQLFLQTNDVWMVSGKSNVFDVPCPLTPPSFLISQNSSTPVSYLHSFQLSFPFFADLLSISNAINTRNVFCQGMMCLNVVLTNATHFRLQWVHGTGTSCQTNVMKFHPQALNWTVVVTPRSIHWLSGTTLENSCFNNQALTWSGFSNSNLVQLDSFSNLGNLVQWANWSSRLLNCEKDSLIVSTLALNPSTCETDPSFSLNIPSSSSFLVGSSFNISWSVVDPSLLVGRQVRLQLQPVNPSLVTRQTKILWEAGPLNASLFSWPLVVPDISDIGCDQSWWIRFKLIGSYSSGWVYSSAFTLSCYQSQITLFSPATNAVLKAGSQNRYTLSWRDDSMSFNTLPSAFIIPEGSVTPNVMFLQLPSVFSPEANSKLLLFGSLNPTRNIQSLSFSIPYLYNVSCGQKQQVAFLQNSKIVTLGASFFLSCDKLYPLLPRENTLASNGTTVLFQWYEGFAGERVDVWLKDSQNTTNLFWVRSLLLSTSSNTTSFVWRVPSDFPCNRSYSTVVKYTSSFFFINNEYEGPRFWIRCLGNSLDTSSINSESLSTFYSVETKVQTNVFNVSEWIPLFCRGSSINSDRSPCLFLTPNDPLGIQLAFRQKNAFSVDGGSCTSRSYLLSGTETSIRIHVYPRFIEMYLNNTLDQTCNYLSNSQPFVISTNRTIQYDQWSNWQGRVQLTSPVLFRDLSCPDSLKNGQSQVCQTIPWVSFVTPSIANDQWYVNTQRKIQWKGVSWFNPGFLLQFDIVPSSSTINIGWNGQIWKSDMIYTKSVETIDLTVPDLPLTSPLCQYASTQSFQIRATHWTDDGGVMTPIRVFSPSFYLACANSTQIFITQPVKNSLLVQSNVNVYTLAWSGGMPGQQIQFRLFQESSPTPINGSEEIFGTISNIYGLQNVTFRLNHPMWSLLDSCGVRYRFGLYVPSNQTTGFILDSFGPFFHLVCASARFSLPTSQTNVFNGSSLNISWWGGPQGVTAYVSLITTITKSEAEFFLRTVTITRDASLTNPNFAWTSFVSRLPNDLPCNQNYAVRMYTANLQYPVVSATGPRFWVSCQKDIVAPSTLAVQSPLVYYRATFQTQFQNHSTSWRNLFCRGTDDNDRVPCVFLTPVDASSQTYLHFRHRSLTDWNSGCNSIKPLALGTTHQVRIEVSPRLIEIFLNDTFDTSCQIPSFFDWGPSKNASTRFDSYNNWVGLVQVSNVTIQLLNESTCREGCLPSFNLNFNTPLIWYFGQTEWINWTYAAGYPSTLLNVSSLSIDLVPVNPVFPIRSLGTSWNVSSGLASISLSLQPSDGCDSSFYLRGRSPGLMDWVYSTSTIFVTCESVQNLVILQPFNNTLLIPGSNSRYLLQWRGGEEGALIQFYLKGTPMNNSNLSTATVWLSLTNSISLVNTRKANQQFFDFMLPFRSWSTLTNYCQYKFQVVALVNNTKWVDGTNVNLLCNQMILLPLAPQVNLNGILNITWLFGQAGRQVHIQLEDQTTGNWSTVAFANNGYSGVTSYLWRIPPSLSCNRFFRMKIQSTSLPSLFGNTIQSSVSDPPFFVKCSRALSLLVEPGSSNTLSVLPTNATSITVSMKGLEPNTAVEIWWSNKTIMKTSPLFSSDQEDILLFSFTSNSNSFEKRVVDLSFFLNQTSRLSKFCSISKLYQIWVMQKNLQQIESFPLLVPCDPILSNDAIQWLGNPQIDLEADQLSVFWRSYVGASVANLMIRENKTLSVLWKQKSLNLLSSFNSSWVIPKAHTLLSCPSLLRFEWEQSIPSGLTNASLSSLTFKTVTVSQGPWFIFSCQPILLNYSTNEASQNLSNFRIPSLSLNSSLLPAGSTQQIQWNGGSTLFSTFNVNLRAVYNHSIQTSLRIEISNDQLEKKSLMWTFPTDSPFNWNQFQQQLPQNLTKTEKEKYRFYLFVQYQIQQEDNQTSDWSPVWVVDYSSYWTKLLIDNNGSSSDNSAAVKRAIILGVVFGALGLLILLFLLKKYKRFKFNQRNKPFRSPPPVPAFRDDLELELESKEKTPTKTKPKSKSPQIRTEGETHPTTKKAPKKKKIQENQIQPGQVRIHLPEENNGQ